MDPLSTPIATFPPRTPAPGAGAATASGAVDVGTLPASVGQARTGTGALSGRQIAVGAGENRERAQGAMAAVRSLLSGLTNALWTLVMSPVALARNIASYVMGTRASDAAAVQSPSRETADAQRQAIDDFHAQAVVLKGGLATDPVLAQAPDVPSGLHFTAVKDWSRSPGVVIDGETYGAAHFAGERDMHAAAGQLTQMCNGNAAAAEWISRFANQQMGMPMMQLLLQLPLGPDGKSGFFLNDPTLTPRISRLGDGAIGLTMQLDWEAGKTPGLYVEAGAPSRVHPDSRLTARCSLRFELPAENTSREMPTVSLLEPVEWAADIRPAPSAADAS